MSRWLLKTEPSTYSFDDLARDQKTPWSGIKNPTALIHIRSMKKGDKAFIYHSGADRSVIGTATIASNPYPDPKANDAKLVIVDVRVAKKLSRPVTLDQIKSDPAFRGFDLLRISRLSVVPVPAAMWDRIEELAMKRSET